MDIQMLLKIFGNLTGSDGWVWESLISLYINLRLPVTNGRLKLERNILHQLLFCNVACFIGLPWPNETDWDKWGIEPMLPTSGTAATLYVSTSPHWEALGLPFLSVLRQFLKVCFALFKTDTGTRFRFIALLLADLLCRKGSRDLLSS